MIWSDLTWCQIFKLTFQGQKARASNRLDKANTMAPLSFSYLSYQISYQLKFISLKTIIFHLMTSTAKTVDLMSNLIEKPCRSIERAFQCFFLIFPSYHSSGENSDCWWKIAIFSKVELWWLLVTSILTWPENNLRKSLRSCRGLSKAVYWLSLSSVFFLDNMGRVS